MISSHSLYYSVSCLSHSVYHLKSYCGILILMESANRNSFCFVLSSIELSLKLCGLFLNGSSSIGCRCENYPEVYFTFLRVPQLLMFWVLSF